MTTVATAGWNDCSATTRAVSLRSVPARRAKVKLGVATAGTAKVSRAGPTRASTAADAATPLQIRRRIALLPGGAPTPPPRRRRGPCPTRRSAQSLSGEGRAPGRASDEGGKADAHQGNAAGEQVGLPEGVNQPYGVEARRLHRLADLDARDHPDLDDQLLRGPGDAEARLLHGVGHARRQRWRRHAEADAGECERAHDGEAGRRRREAGERAQPRD